MKQLLSALAAMALVGSAQGGSQVDELVAREQMALQVASLWAKEDFPQLDKLSVSYRVTRSRTPSGLWQLTEFYEALANQAAESMDRTPSISEGEERSKKWVRQLPNSPAANLQFAGTLIKQGWNARGNGFANTVTVDAAAVFQQKLSVARAYLERTKSSSSIDPHWYGMMIGIATWQDWPETEFNLLFDEAISKDPTYLEIYFNGLSYYSPRWHGSEDKMDQFIVRTANKTAGADGDALYARMYWGAAEGFYNGRLNATKANCPRMMRGIDRLMQTFPERRNINYFAKFAVDCADKPRAKALFEKIGENPLLEAWWNSAKYFVQFKSWAM